MEKRVYQDIASILEDYTNQGKVLDEKVIVPIVNMVVETRKLTGCVNNLAIVEVKDIKPPQENTTGILKIFKKRKPLTSSTLAKYNPDTGFIILYLTKHTKYLNNFYRGYFEDKDRLMYVNLLIVKSLLHELEHAHQKKIFYDSTGSDLQGFSYIGLDPRLLYFERFKRKFGINMKKCELNRVLKARPSSYNSTYNINPCERLAELYSDRTANIVMDSSFLKYDFDKVYTVESIEYLEKLLEAYEIYDKEHYSCPVEEYFSKILLPECWKKLFFYDEDIDRLYDNISNMVSVRSRLESGLIATQDELQPLYDRKERLEAKIHNKKN